MTKHRNEQVHVLGVLGNVLVFIYRSQQGTSIASEWYCSPVYSSILTSS